MSGSSYSSSKQDLTMLVYCDYCDVFLTHDSASVRKAHNSGRSHAQNVRDYYTTVAQEMAELEALEAPVKTREARIGLRMPEPVNGKGYGPIPTMGLPLPVPYGVPQRPGFPAQVFVPPNMQPLVAPGVKPPVLQNAQPGNALGIPGSMLGPGGVLLPPPNLPKNFAQLQAEFQERYLAGDRGVMSGARDDRPPRTDRPMRNDARRF